MGHKYVKESDIFNTAQNGIVPKPTAAEVSDNKFLRADGTWKTPGSGSGHTYSTTEQVIGTWIDGKPLYEITINMGAMPSNAGVISKPSPANIEFIIDYEGFIFSSNKLKQRPLPFSADGTNVIRVDYDSSNLNIITYSGWNGYSAYLTIKYTKTTDLSA